MAFITGSLLNDVQLQQAFNALPAKLRTKVVRQTLREEAEPIADIARAFAPVKTGKLRKSIAVVNQTKAERGVIGAVVRTGSRKSLGIAADDPYYYPAAVEFGTSTIPAKSYMRRALFSVRGGILSKLQSGMRRKIDSVIAAEIRRGLNKFNGSQ